MTQNLHKLFLIELFIHFLFILALFVVYKLIIIHTNEKFGMIKFVYSYLAIFLGFVYCSYFVTLGLTYFQLMKNFVTLFRPERII